MTRVLHVITSLDTGGAELSLARLLELWQGDAQWQHHVVSLLPPGPVAARLEAAGITPMTLNMRRGRPALKDAGAVPRLSGIIRRLEPEIVQTWLYHADLLGLLAAGLAARWGRRNVPVVWNLRSADMDFTRYGRATGMVFKACAALSGRPRAIIANSTASRDHHLAQGYRPREIVVIPNGVDVERFRPDPEARAAVRAELGLRDSELAIGMLARFDPMKDFPTFLAAAGLLVRERPHGLAGVRFVLAGDNVDPANPELARLAAEHGISDRLLLVGRRDDPQRFLAALDIYGASSLSESFPNAVAEAMAVGLAVASTAAGDAGAIVGEQGRVVPVGDAPALARAWSELSALSPEARRELGQAARSRVSERFSQAAMLAAYKELYERIVAP